MSQWTTHTDLTRPRGSVHEAEAEVGLGDDILLEHLHMAVAWYPP